MSDRNFSSDSETAPLAVFAEQSAAQSVSVGAKLASCRLEKGWTVEQVASSLKLAPRQIEAIETDNYSMLPGMAVTRGFVRAYAKLLRIDAVPLLATMGSATDAALPGARVVAAPFSDAKRSTFGKKRSSRKLIFGILLLGGAALAVLGFQQINALLPSFKQFAQQQPAEIPEVAVQQGVSDAVVSSSSKDSTTAALPEGQSANPAANGVTPDDNGGVPLQSATSADAPQSSNQASNSVASTNNLLQLTMKQDSWLEVRRVAGNDVIAARLVKAGTVETFQVDGPVKLTVGNVAGVDASLRGEPIQLKTAAGGNVARMTIE